MSSTTTASCARELESHGVRFATASDTEVVLEAWRAWGQRALRRFRGMYAFGIHDERTCSLTLARDPLGIKPLYVMPRGGGVLFASELKAIVTAVGPELDGRPHRHGRVRPLLLGPRRSWTRSWGCTACRPARGPSTAATARWRPASTGTPPPRRPLRPTAHGPTSERWWRASVEAHLVADAPVATFLSGGLDSSIITALAHRSEPSIEAYTIVFRPEDQRLESMPDDARYARRLARHLGIRLHEIEIHPDIVDMLPRMVDVLDEPIGDPAAINTLLMCDAAREAGVKVLLSGMGADELFGGYRKHLAMLVAERYRRMPGAVRSAVAPAVRAPARGGRGARPADGPLGAALPHLRRAPRAGGLPAELHALRHARSSPACSTPPCPATSTPSSTGTARCTRTTTSTTS